MKNLLYVSILLLIGACALGACEAGKNGNTTSGDTVAVKVDTMMRSGEFTKSNGNLCRVKVSMSVAYPEQFRDDKAVKRLQQLFKSEIFDAPDSVEFQQVLEQYAASFLTHDSAENANSPIGINPEMADDSDDVDIDSITMIVDIKIIYNKRDIVSFVKEEKMLKNGKQASTAHRYYNFDLQAMALIELNRLFNDHYRDQLTALLKDKLLETNNAKSEDQLNELGFFNLPNFEVNNNFFFTDDTITWSYEPNTLAVSAVGEPQITVSIDDLKSFALDNSLLNRF